MLLAGAVLLTLMLVAGAVFGRGARDVPTQTVILGSILVAACLFYTMCYRVRPEDGVTVARLIGAFALAAFITTFIAGGVNTLIAHLAPSSGAVAIVGTTRIGLTSVLFVGPVEETLKALTVLAVGIRLPVKTFRSGLFVGGAVGLGFAAMENTQYLAQVWEHPIYSLPSVGSLAIAAGLRSVITPLLHPILTALIGGAIYGATRDGRYRFSIMVVGTWFAALGIHSLWDTIPVGLQILRHRMPTLELGLLALLGFGLILGVAIGLPFVWRAVARHANRLAGLDARGRTIPPAPPSVALEDPPPPAAADRVP